MNNNKAKVHKLKTSPQLPRMPLWLLTVMGYLAAARGAKHGDIKARVYSFADKRIDRLKKKRKKLSRSAQRFKDINRLEWRTNLIVVSLAENEDRYKVNGVEQERDRIFKQQRNKQLKKSIVNISEIVEKAEKAINDSRSDLEERLDSEMKAYYTGLAKYLRTRKGYDKIDPNEAKLRCFVSAEELSLFDELLIFIPHLKETMAALDQKCA